MINLLYFFLFIVVIKFVLNFTKYIQCRYHLTKYRAWISNGTPESGFEFEQGHLQITRLFKDAGIQDASRPHLEPLGLGYVSTSTVSIFDNLAARREDIISTVLTMFNQAIGVYRSRMLNTFNPFYWLEVIINLPREALIYLGVSAESVVVRVFQLVYWIVAFALGFLFALYRPEFETLIRDWISKLTP